jgi:NTP pyrophosphatase (non-canonical NTP hydrolase)
MMDRIYDIDDYLLETEKTAIYPGACSRSQQEGTYLALGLVGEAGEVAEKMKKLIRDGNLDPDLFKKELGDVFWYLVRLCQWAGAPPSEIITSNVIKLRDRQARNTLHGSGDTR